MKNFVGVDWLKEHLTDDNVIIIDCRFNLHDMDYGLKQYKKSHIANAFYFDMDKDLSGNRQMHGGYRPIPDINSFKSKLEAIGINNDTVVVAYDDGLNAAPRLWWLLKYLNHKNCFILDGGFNEWLNHGYPLTKTIPAIQYVKNYTLNINNTILCDIEYVKQKKELDDIALVDSRNFKRYSGLLETLYSKAGHIPKAVNCPWENNISNGFIRNIEILNKNFQNVLHHKEIILYCGSGIAACGNYLALDELGISSAVYIGGFSDWISYEDNPVSKA